MPNPKVIYDKTNKNKFLNYKPKAYENFDAYKHDIDRWSPDNSKLFYNSIIETANLNKDNKDIVKDCLAYMLTMYVLQKETGKSIRELTTKYAYSFSYYEVEKTKNDILESGVIDNFMNNKQPAEAANSALNETNKFFEDTDKALESYYEKKLSDEKMLSVDTLLRERAVRKSNDNVATYKGEQFNVKPEAKQKALQFKRDLNVMKEAFSDSAYLFGGPFGHLPEQNNDMNDIRKAVDTFSSDEKKISNYKLYKSQKTLQNLDDLLGKDAKLLKSSKYKEIIGGETTVYYAQKSENPKIKEIDSKEYDNKLNTAVKSVGNYLGINMGIDNAIKKSEQKIEKFKSANAWANQELEKTGSPTVAQLKSKKNNLLENDVKFLCHIENNLYFSLKSNNYKMVNDYINNSIAPYRKILSDIKNGRTCSDISLLNARKGLEGFNEFLSTEVDTPKFMKEKGYGDKASILTVLYAGNPKYKNFIKDLQNFEKDYKFGIGPAIEKTLKELEVIKEIEKAEEADRERIRQQAIESEKAKEKAINEQFAKDSANARKEDEQKIREFFMDQREEENNVKDYTTNKMSKTINDNLSPLTNSLKLKRHWWGGVMNKSLEKLNELTTDIVNRIDYINKNEAVDSLFKIREEAKRLADRKPEAKNVLEAVNKVLAEPEFQKIVISMEETAERKLNPVKVIHAGESQEMLGREKPTENNINADAPAGERTAADDLHDIVWSDQTLFHQADISMADSKKDFPAVKEVCEKAIATVISGLMYEKAFTGMKDNKDILTPTPMEMYETIQNAAEDLRRREDFKHMMASVHSKQDLKFLQEKAVNGSELLLELGKHSKLLQHEEKKLMEEEKMINERKARQEKELKEAMDKAEKNMNRH